jgi:type II secretory pathway pseudopilin PulG
LLVVIAIIGLLSTLAVVALNNARAKARDARRLSDIKQIQTALELYYAEVGHYPDDVAQNVCGTNAAGHIAGCCLSNAGAFSGTCSGTTYMSEVPANPTPLDGCALTEYTYTVNDQTAGDGASYTLNYCVGQDNGNISGGDTHNATPAGIINDN